MTSKTITNAIGSYEARLRYEKQRAYNAITVNDFTIAATAVAEAMKLKGAIEELEFILEEMEVEGNE